MAKRRFRFGQEIITPEGYKGFVVDYVAEDNPNKVQVQVAIHSGQPMGGSDQFYNEEDLKPTGKNAIY